MSEVFLWFCYELGYELPYVLTSAVFTALAITVRQTNVILTVLNPMLIVFQRYGILHKSPKYPTFFSQLLHFVTLLYSEFRTVFKIIAPFLIILLFFIAFSYRMDFQLFLVIRNTIRFLFISCKSAIIQFFSVASLLMILC